MNGVVCGRRETKTHAHAQKITPSGRLFHFISSHTHHRHRHISIFYPAMRTNWETAVVSSNLCMHHTHTHTSVASLYVCLLPTHKYTHLYTHADRKQGHPSPLPQGARGQIPPVDGRSFFARNDGLRTLESGGRI